MRFGQVSSLDWRRLVLLLNEPHLSRLLSRSPDIGGINAAVCRWTNAPCADTEHQTIIDDVAVETRIVALQTLGGDAVGAGDAFARVLIGSLVDELAVVAVATETEPRADLEGVAIGASAEEVESEDLVGGCEGLLTDSVARVACLDDVVTRAGGVVGVESSSRKQR